MIIKYLTINGTLLFLLAFVFIMKAQDLNSQWKTIDSLVKADDQSQLFLKFPPFLAELEKNKMNRQLIVACYHYANTLVKTGDLFLADSFYNKAKDIALLESLKDNYKEITSAQISNLYNAVHSSGILSNSDILHLLTLCYTYANEIDSYHFKKSVKLLRIGIERKNNLLNQAIISVKELITEVSINEPSNKELIGSLNFLLAELNFQTGINDSASIDNLSPEQYARLLIHQGLESEKNGDIHNALKTLSKLSPADYTSLKWEMIVDLSRKRFELGDKISQLHEVLIDLIQIQNILINDSTVLDKNKLEFLKLIIIGNLQFGKLRVAYDEITKIEKALSENRLDNRYSSDFFRIRGDISLLQGDYDDAIQYYKKALDDHQDLKSKEYYSLLNNLGISYYKCNRPNESINIFEVLFNEITDPQLIKFKIQADLNSGIVFVKNEQFENALIKFKRAQDEAKKNNILPLNLIAGMRIAEIYHNQGFNDFAAERFLEVKHYVNDINEPQEKISLLAAIGLYERKQNNLESALSFFNQAFTLANQLNFVSLKQSIAGELGDTHLISGDPNRAKFFYERVLSMIESSGVLTERIMYYIKLSKCYYVLRDYKNASGILTSAIKLLNTSSNDYLKATGHDVIDVYAYILCLTELASNNYSLGLVNSDIKNILFAYREAVRAAQLIDEYSVTQLIAAKDNNNSTKYLETYHLLVDIALELYNRTGDSKYLYQSFDVSERSRASEYISEVGAGLIDKLNDQDLESISAFSQQISSEATNTSKGLITFNESGLTGDQQKRGIKVVKDTTNSIVKLQNKYDDILSGLRQNKHAAAELVSVSTLNIFSVQQLMGEDQIILNYYVSKEAIYLFCIDKDSISLRTIDMTELELQEVVREFRIHIQDPTSNAYRSLSELLYQKLLNPVSERIADKKLIVIPSGLLHNLPFSALIKNGKFLIEEHLLTVLPNVSSLQFFKNKVAITANSALIGMGNPINNYTSPLAGTELEVKAISQIFKKSQMFLREKALESSAKRELTKADIIHIASHGLFNYEYPLLSCLALTGDNKDDGRLELHEIYNLNLNKTSLVVLSACETALSQIKENDEMIGLVRGFLFTGASSVIASLWKVDDSSTYELMVKFYTNLATSGYSKGLSLQMAQVEMIKSSYFTHPYYWSAFILNGME